MNGSCTVLRHMGRRAAREKGGSMHEYDRDGDPAPRMQGGWIQKR